jgi:hypothetical protein
VFAPFLGYHHEKAMDEIRLLIIHPVALPGNLPASFIHIATFLPSLGAFAESLGEHHNHVIFAHFLRYHHKKAMDESRLLIFHSNSLTVYLPPSFISIVALLPSLGLFFFQFGGAPQSRVFCTLFRISSRENNG